VFPELLKEHIAGICELSPDQIDQLHRHYKLLVRWNKALNLTTVIKLPEAVERHYAESLFLGAHLPPGPLSIVDIGSGAGFPGIPVGILRRDCRVALAESHQRKAVFLKEATRDLQNFTVSARRFEQLPHSFDWAISRAVEPKQVIESAPAPNLALLTGDIELGGEWKSIRLPWGSHRFLMLRVSRGTG
jgi:16S rRNA (guanine527-N7)-methyltransferase